MYGGGGERVESNDKVPPSSGTGTFNPKIEALDIATLSNPEKYTQLQCRIHDQLSPIPDHPAVGFTLEKINNLWDSSPSLLQDTLIVTF